MSSPGDESLQSLSHHRDESLPTLSRRDESLQTLSPFRDESCLLETRLVESRDEFLLSLSLLGIESLQSRSPVQSS